MSEQINKMFEGRLRWVLFESGYSEIQQAYKEPDGSFRWRSVPVIDEKELRGFRDPNIETYADLPTTYDGPYSVVEDGKARPITLKEIQEKQDAVQIEETESKVQAQGQRQDETEEASQKK